MNSANSTKQRPYASKGPISRICRLLLALGAVKLALLASLVFMPAESPMEPSKGPFVAPSAVSSASTANSSFNNATATGSQEAAPGERSMLAALEQQKNQWPAEEPIAKAPEIAETPAKAQEVAETPVKAPQRRTGIAYAAESVPMPVPNVSPMASPVSPDTVIRPDDPVPSTPPAPSVPPLPSRDSAQEKQAELNRREQELLNLQQQMEARVKELNSLENRVQGMLKDANKEQDGKMQHLVDTYANMKPRQAAQVLATLDERIAVKILSGLKSKQAGEIFSYMDPGRAAVLSELLSKMQLQ